MRIEEVDIPVYRSEYDDIFDAVLKAWRRGRAVKVFTEKHPNSVRTAIKNRLNSSDETRHLYLTVSVEDDGCVLYIEKEASPS